jgi:hypothetical protein
MLLSNSIVALSTLTTVFIVLSAVSGIALLFTVYLDYRRSRIDDSIAAFRRHIDALSPESRRSSVMRDSDDGADWRYRK